MSKTMPAALYPLLAAIVLIFTAGVPVSRQVPGAPLNAEPKFRFRHHLVDTELTGEGFGQTALADLTGDGRSEFIMGRRNGELYAYRFHAPDRWTRSSIGTESPSDVGLAVVDVDRDGRPDLVSGGAWYRNSGDLSRSFQRQVFDRELAAVHDVVAADVDGDGRPDILTMSDRIASRFVSFQ